MSGILVIRGGAIGDFVLTLPAIRLLREAFPGVPLEILGYRHIVSLAVGRYYADAARSIEYAGLASFFVPGGKLHEDLGDYFCSFSQVISYLYDPDRFFEENLRRAGVENLICGYTRLDGSAHAARQLAKPLEQLALYLGDGGEEAILHPSEGDRAAAAAFLDDLPQPIVAVHPGAGGQHKLWPLERWSELLSQLRALPGAPSILLIGGEADHARIEALRPLADRVALNRPLPELAAILARCSAFLGHDSGVSHIAAAAGTPSLLLFGPTDPAVWAPGGPHVQTLKAPEGRLEALAAAPVFAQLSKLLILG